MPHRLASIVRCLLAALLVACLSASLLAQTGRGLIVGRVKDSAGAVLQGADLGEANLDHADLRRADLGGVRWKQIRSVAGANLYGVRNAPEGFADWAMKHGAVAHTDGE